MSLIVPDKIFEDFPSDGWAVIVAHDAATGANAFVPVPWTSLPAAIRRVVGDALAQLVKAGPPAAKTTAVPGTTVEVES